jgi:F0F1-type ATP synthase epsilon subunit
MSQTAQDQMHIKVYSPFQTYFDGPGKSISGNNDTGQFDILPKHHNFLTLLNAGDLVIQTERGPQKIQISRGLMHVKADKVVVFLDI